MSVLFFFFFWGEGQNLPLLTWFEPKNPELFSNTVDSQGLFPPLSHCCFEISNLLVCVCVVFSGIAGFLWFCFAFQSVCGFSLKAGSCSAGLEGFTLALQLQSFSSRAFQAFDRCLARMPL